jgi:hypothetical protein
VALIIRQPTSNQTPDATLGGAAVTDITNTGHGSTTTTSSVLDSPPPGSPVNDADNKTARWFALQDVGGEKILVKLKFSWDVSGSCNATGGFGLPDPQIDGTASAEGSFHIDYSVNGGSNWTQHVSDSMTASSVGASDSDSFNNASSADITLSNAQDVSQVQVRVQYQTSANAEAGNGLENAVADSTIDATVSGIQVEVTTVDGTVIIIM